MSLAFVLSATKCIETSLFQTNPMDMINTISITLSEEMLPSEPTETSVSRRENEVFANPSTSETTSRDNTRESSKLTLQNRPQNHNPS